MNIFLTNAGIYYWMAVGNHVPDLHPSRAVAERGVSVVHRCKIHIHRCQRLYHAAKWFAKMLEPLWWLQRRGRLEYGGSITFHPIFLILLLVVLRSSDGRLYIRLFTKSTRVFRYEACTIVV